MALWSFNDKTARIYRKRAHEKKEKEFIVHSGGFFRSDKGGEKGIRIDYIERRQAAQAMDQDKIRKELK